MSPELDASERPLIFDGLVISRWGRPFFERLRAGGIGGIHATAAVWEGTEGTVRNLERWSRWFAQNADLIRPARSAEDVRTAHGAGVTGVLLGLQNTDALEGNIDRAARFYEMGVRVLQLTYNNQNYVAGSCYEPSDSGVSRFGRELIQELAELGILVDLSHVGDRSAMQAIELSPGPVAITHANPRWFHDIPRNKPPEVLRALVERGGILGLCTFPMLLPRSPTGGYDIDAFCDMVARVVDELGPDHVALGTDFTAGQPLEFFQWLESGNWTRGTSVRELPVLPDWAQGPEDLPGVIARLRRHGLGEAETRAIAGENWLRLLDTVGSGTH
jgi:membrane dipeptidase